MERELEQRLVRGAQLGSVDCFSQLVHQMQDGLYRFLILHGATPHDAEDIAQETFLTAWRKIKLYRHEWRFSTWLYTIARRIAFRSREESPAVRENPVVAVAPTPDTEVFVRQRRENLWAIAFDLLPRDHFIALWLYYGEDRDIQEISMILKRSRSWVKINLHRSRQKLANTLSPEEWTGDEVAFYE